MGKSPFEAALEGFVQAMNSGETPKCFVCGGGGTSDALDAIKQIIDTLSKSCTEEPKKEGKKCDTRMERKNYKAIAEAEKARADKAEALLKAVEVAVEQHIGNQKKITLELADKISEMGELLQLVVEDDVKFQNAVKSAINGDD